MQSASKITVEDQSINPRLDARPPSHDPSGLLRVIPGKAGALVHVIIMTRAHALLIARSDMARRKIPRALLWEVCNRAVVDDHLTHLLSLEPDTGLPGDTGLLDELGEDVQAEQTDDGEGDGEGGLGTEELDAGLLSDVGGDDTTGRADLLPLGVAGDGGVLEEARG
jgi:hypothetical protein